MKIAIVNRHPNDVIGGSELQCDNIALGLTLRGHEIIYIAPAGKIGADYHRPYAVVPVKSNGRAIANAVAAAKPDIVYWRLNKYHFLAAARRLARKKIPIVFAISHVNDTKWWSVHANPKAGLRPFLKSIKQGLKNTLNHFGFCYVAGVTSVNPDYLNRLRIREQAFVPSSVDTHSVPFAWKRPFVLWASNIKAAKQPEKFVALAQSCTGMGIDFLMVGQIQDPAYDWIKDENNRTPHFHHLTNKTLQDVNGILTQSLFLVHTCRAEGFPNIFLQAWMQKKTVVTFDFDPANYIERYKLGAYAKGDWNRFLYHVRSYIEDGASRVEAGTRAYDLAATEFSRAQTLDTLERFLFDILTKKQEFLG